MLELVFPTYEFALVYAQKLVADVPDDQLAAQPVPGRSMNHAAFTLGHLAWANDNALKMLGGSATMDAAWVERFAMGKQPLPDRSAYPSKEVLLQTLEAAHRRLLDAARAATPELLNQPAPERMRHRFPTLGHMLAGLMSGHYTNHLGQLSAWRRAMGYPSVF